MVREVKKRCNEYKIILPQVERNGMHVLAARWDISFDMVVTLALDLLLRAKLSKEDYDALIEDDFTNQMIGESVNANRNVFGFDAEVNPIPKDKQHYLIPVDYDEEEKT